MIDRTTGSVGDSLGALGERHWDVVVIGAGPGGSVLARAMAMRGRSVLLVEKARFPRWKVCGACLGASGIRTLDEQGLGGLPARVGAHRITRADLAWRSRRVGVALNRMVAVSRGAFDSALALAAQEAGVTALFGVRAASWEEGRVVLESDAVRRVVRAGSVVVSVGLRAPGATVWAGSRMGLGAVGPGQGAETGVLLMAVGDAGYVGRVVTEDGCANWAAAVDPGFLQARGSPVGAVRALLDEAGVCAEPPETGWTGTPALTRRCPVQQGSMYRIGDAAAYAEPITGEGMSWALWDAGALAPILERALARGDHPAAWSGLHGAASRRRRARCMGVALALRSRGAMHAGMSLLGAHGGGAGLLTGVLTGHRVLGVRS